MSKIIYDVIQRFEVKDGIPRLLSTNIQVIQGGEDLLSLAMSMLAQLGFENKFEEKRTSQYIGYKSKQAKKGGKRYQLVLVQKQDSLCISIPQNVLEPLILTITYYSFVGNWKDVDYEMITLGRFWVLPSRKDIFIKTFKYSEVNLNGHTQGSFYFNWTSDYIPDRDYPKHFSPKNLAQNDSYLFFDTDKLFPYTWQTLITSKEILEDFIRYFAKILMEQ